MGWKNLTDDPEPARQRAERLRERAMNRPVGSNGRRKDLATARALEGQAQRMTTERQRATTARVRALGIWTP